MLEAFKNQARKAVQAKVLLIDKLNEEAMDKDAKIIRIKERIVEKSYKGLMSDVEDSPEEEQFPFEITEFYTLITENLDKIQNDL